MVAETRRQLDVVRLPSIDELDAGLRRDVRAAQTHPRALALFYAVRGRPDDAQDVVRLAAEHHERESASERERGGPLSDRSAARAALILTPRAAWRSGQPSAAIRRTSSGVNWAS